MTSYKTKSLLRVLSSPRWCVTVIISACGLGVFYLLDWMWARTLIAQIMTSVFTLTGYQAEYINDQILLPSLTLKISRECTYIDWFLLAVPFVWTNQGFSRNIVNITIFAVCIGVFNLIRIYISTACYFRGVSWFWSHDIVAYIIILPLFVFLVLRWLILQIRNVPFNESR